MVDMLRDIIPASWRKPIYAIYAVIGVVLGAIQIAIEPDPSWLVTSMTVYVFLGGAVGAVANSNTPAEDEYVPENVVEQDGE